MHDLVDKGLLTASDDADGDGVIDESEYAIAKKRIEVEEKEKAIESSRSSESRASESRASESRASASRESESRASEQAERERQQQQAHTAPAEVPIPVAVGSVPARSGHGMVQAGAVPVHLDLRPKRLDVAGRCIRLLRRPGRLRLLLRDQAGCPLGADGPPLIALSQHLFDGFLGGRCGCACAPCWTAKSLGPACRSSAEMAICRRLE